MANIPGVPFLILPHDTIRWRDVHPNIISALESVFCCRDFPFRPLATRDFVSVATAMTDQRAHNLYLEGFTMPATQAVEQARGA